MHALLHILAVGTSTTTKTSKKSSSSTYTLLFIVVIFGAVYFLFLRPRQQKMRQQHGYIGTVVAQRWQFDRDNVNAVK